MRALGAGVALTVVVTTLEYLAWGREALVAGAAFGLIGTGIQVAAIRALKPGLTAPLPELMKRWAIGLGLRLGGVVLFVAAVLLDRTLFPPLPTAFGYLGVVIPLLFAETKLANDASRP